MKSFLLDTHIWLWSLVDPKRLSSKVHSLLEDKRNELFLSPISIWEALLLGERGRISMDPNPENWIRDALTMSPIQEAMLNHEIAIRSRSLKTAHSDPADRFLLATANVFGLTLITADRELWNCGEIGLVKCT